MALRNMQLNVLASAPLKILTVALLMTTACAHSTTLVEKDGSYATVPLEKDKVVVKVVQNLTRNLQDFPNVREGLDHNLNQMTRLTQQACTTGKKPDFILFNEFPLTGYSEGTREEKLQFTIQIPGPETEALGKLAKECDTYIIFGSYARDDAWPGHILSLNAVIGRDGKVAEKFWKTRNVKNYQPDSEIPTTTIENVYDRYVAMYGEEELFPVLRTEYGNIAVSTVQRDTMVFNAFAMRGVEIMFRTSTLFSKLDVMATASFNNFYSAMSNINFPADSEWAHMGGQSLIVDPQGKVLAEDPSNNEGIIEAEIDIAALRKGRKIPDYPMDVTRPVFAQYVPAFPLNHLDVPIEELPDNGAEMKVLMDKASRWK
ncbi:nitrilase-related carbon-nitrogen hydrolase [Novilysobacter antarcticus]|uniref:nitrilase-related carbon-nitrogen hydrolase n=1 Tax=Novilysobacter antarcticus TaxID=2862543 RepID=UPI001C98EB68|nr:nitrilase-related carbon-nitrogen hydrolase [Lysobacter antarcticus]